MVELFANSGDPDQMPHSAASDLDLHCLPNVGLWAPSLQWINGLNDYNSQAGNMAHVPRQESKSQPLYAEVLGQTGLSNQCRPRSDATECGI